MKINDKPLIWLHGEIKTPPFSSAARIEAGFLFRLLQMGEKLNMPHSSPMSRAIKTSQPGPRKPATCFD